MPLWNATEMAAALQSSGSNVQLHTYAGSTHSTIWSNQSFSREWSGALANAMQGN